ncbi:hypothetical protein D2A66_02395 [Enterococcus faecalis]|nr:hypothetical protein [Enterococcus faecalis]EGO8832103.1 hypothetical protein [Enterococcus faecalis]EGO9017630.1 hypothetical protein [Enterococcus faecalis]EGO9057710.1 hypothetical protein [Enterococcus faecalis]EGO9149484.1 hypothetical protein [Enterococcus faecalis]
MLFNFWRISAYFRRSWLCFRRLSGFKPGAKIQSDFCSRLVYFLKSSYVKKTQTIVHSPMVCVFISKNHQKL